MKRVSFICANSEESVLLTEAVDKNRDKQNLFRLVKKAFMLSIVLVVMNLLPLPTTPFLSNNILVAEAKETDADSGI